MSKKTIIYHPKLVWPKSDENNPWWITSLPVLRLAPMPFVVLAILSSFLSYFIAANMKSDRASVTILKYMAMMDTLYMIQRLNHLIQSKSVS